MMAAAREILKKTALGDVKGFDNGRCEVFLGVPYAKAGRFEYAVMTDHWDGVLDATVMGATCPQNRNIHEHLENPTRRFYKKEYREGAEYAMDEDCLNLNIWTPGTDEKKRPVLFWLHGGGYTSGNGQEHPGYDGRNLADKGDVVVVTINHRLNVLGFLDLSAFGDKYKEPANVGMTDIVAALRWVKENIAYFGGDPDCVTIFGQSGGGGKVSTLLCMPSAQGLFHRAMVMSGSFLGSTPQKEAREVGELTAWYLGLTSATIDSIQRVPYEKLLDAANKAFGEVSRRNRDKQTGHGIRLGWGPVNDGDIMPGIFENGSEKKSNDVPLLIGSTLNEFSTPKVDEMVRPAVIQQATIRCQDGGAPVYVYLSAYQSPTMDGSFHACHNSDIPFFFNNVVKSAQMTGATKEGIALGEQMSSALLNFARTGNPNGPKGKMNIKGLPQWPAFTPDTEATMRFDAPKSTVTTKQ